MTAQTSSPPFATTPSSGTLAAALWPAADSGAGQLLRPACLALAGTLFIALCAHIKVPMVPVPMTMQTFAILVVGMAFGWRLGLATVLLYIGEGMAGLPVFTNAGASPAYLLGPTGGYIAGFAVAAAATGWLAERGWDRSIWTTLPAMAIGTVCILGLGVAWLSTLIGFDTAIAAGLLPFVWGALVKIALAAAVLPGAWWVVARIRG